MAKIRIIGIDPGLRHTGWGLIALEGVRLSHIADGSVHSDAETPLAERLKAAGTKFVIEPYVRFRGEPGEQATMFFLDPFGNAIEVKAFADITRLFAK